MLKKGISEKIATVILVGFTIALLALVILWGKNFLQERAIKQGKIAEIKLKCESLDLSIVNSYQQGPKAVIVLKNKKDINIPKFTFRFEGQDSEPKESLDNLNNLEVKKYEIDFGEEKVKNLKRVVVIPWLKASIGNYIPCNNKQISSSF